MITNSGKSPFLGFHACGWHKTSLGLELDKVGLQFRVFIEKALGAYGVRIPFLG
jgi:hypothetical protein